MAFQEWWKTIDKDFSAYAIPEEIEWFAEKAWNQAYKESKEIGDAAEALFKAECEEGFWNIMDGAK